MALKDVYYWISIQVLSEISHTSCNKLRKTYRSIIKNNCVPLSEIDPASRGIYVKDYLLHDRLIDFSFLDAVNDYESTTPLKSPDVQALFREMEMIRRGLSISKSYAGTSTVHLKELAREYGISYSTFSRRRSIYMKTTPLYRALVHDVTNEDTVDRHRTCCFYCRDLIIFKHEMAGKISAAKIFRDIRDADPFPCNECPYNPVVKEKSKSEFVPAATCMRNSTYMVKPNCDDTVLAIVNRIPEQQDVLAWEGVRSWALKFHYTPPREKPKIVNQVWFSDHKELDLLVRVKRMPDGTWKTQRPWITAILDAASDVLVSYILSLNPNSDCIAECFARACAFTVDTPYCGIPDYFYIDNGKDFRSKKMKGLSGPPLYLNRDFGESGILEWFGIRVIHALPYRGCSKTIERIWKTIDDEWIRECPGYCGPKPELRPPGLKDDIKKDRIYTFEQFADYFADTIYPEYNNFSVTKESPNALYAKLPKTSSFVPTWRTLSVLKSVSCTRVIRPKGIQYGKYGDGKPKLYWCPELAPLIEKDGSTQ